MLETIAVAALVFIALALTAGFWVPLLLLLVAALIGVVAGAVKFVGYLIELVVDGFTGLFRWVFRREG